MCIIIETVVLTFNLTFIAVKNVRSAFYQQKIKKKKQSRKDVRKTKRQERKTKQHEFMLKKHNKEPDKVNSSV